MKSFLFFVLLWAASPVWAIEDYTLITPITKPAVAKFQVQSFSFNVTEHTVSITVVEVTTGETFTCVDSGSTADAFLINLNKRDFSGANISLHRRLINAANTKCPTIIPAGTFSGTPQ